jgi:hypothetical protein
MDKNYLQQPFLVKLTLNSGAFIDTSQQNHWFVGYIQCVLKISQVHRWEDVHGVLSQICWVEHLHASRCKVIWESSQKFGSALQVFPGMDNPQTQFFLM